MWCNHQRGTTDTVEMGSKANDGKVFVEELSSQLDQMNVDDVSRRMSIEYDDQPYSQQGEIEPEDDKVQPTPGPGQDGCNILIVTNVDPSIFSDQVLKSKFESLFKDYDTNVAFRYLKSFKRVRLDFSRAELAEEARIKLNDYQLGSSSFKCYSAQMIRMPTNCNSLDNEDSIRADNYISQTIHLNIPKPTKQFLISPPASPPVGWEPVTESSPCMDVQIMSAIANLVPGQMHEIHAGSESQPGIYVEVCEEAHFDNPKATRIIPKTPSPFCASMQH